MSKMTFLVTGCAGFIGSSTALELLKRGYSVRGIDRFSDYYSRELKEKNITVLKDFEQFKFIEGDLASVDLNELLKGIDIVIHDAAQAGVRSSWGKSFNTYIKDNIVTTQRLLETVKEKKIVKFVYASSSSVYGDVKKLPMNEDMKVSPVSPYGVTKLDGENLVMLYNKNYGVLGIALRYFTVFGPRQRPDMAFHKFIKAILKGEPIEIYGDGSQTRDFTYISDIVEANITAALSNVKGEVFNIGGGKRIKLNEVIKMMENIIGIKAKLYFINPQKGDVQDTYADISKAKELLGYTPRVSLEEGLEREVEWIKSLLNDHIE